MQRLYPIPYTLYTLTRFFGLMLFAVITLFFLLPTHSVIAADANQIKDSYGVSGIAVSAGLQRFTSVPGLVGIVLGTVLSLIGIAFFALVLYGGILWMTARGNADQQKKAFETIISGSIGVVLILSAYALTRFVFSTVEQSCGIREQSPCYTISADRCAEITTGFCELKNGDCMPSAKCGTLVTQEQCHGVQAGPLIESSFCEWK